MIMVYLYLIFIATQINASHQEVVDSFFKSSDSIEEYAKHAHTQISTAQKEYWLLSLDGGGERGILHLATLAELEKKTGQRIVDMFDGIAGTSIGGIIAILLTIPDPSDSTKPKYTAKELLDIFFEKRYQMFQPKWFSFNGFFRTKYKTRGMKDFLFNMLEGNTLKNRWLPTTIVTHDLSTFSIRTFSSIDNDDYFAKDIAMATAAAPTYYKPQKIIPINKPHAPTYFVSDGGTCMSSPTHAGIAMLKKIHHINSKKIHVLSLGTGFVNQPFDNSNLCRGSGLEWFHVIVNLLMLGQQNTDIHVASLNHGKNYHRFNPFITPDLMTFDSLSDTSGKAILQANQQMLIDRAEEFNQIAEKLKILAESKEKRIVQDLPHSIISRNSSLQNVISWLSCWCRANINKFFLSKMQIWQNIKAIFSKH